MAMGPWRWYGAPWRASAREDAGLTLVEVVVTVAVMSVAMSLVTTGLVAIYRTANHNDTLSLAVSQLQTAFQRLDQEVRYASVVTEPSIDKSASQSWYVEWAVLDAGVSRCTQLRLDEGAGQLQRRTRDGSGSVTGWTTVASYVVPGRPFSQERASASRYPHDRLTVILTLRVGSGQTATSRRSQWTFTALNTSFDAPTAGLCDDLDRP